MSLTSSFSDDTIWLLTGECLLFKGYFSLFTPVALLLMCHLFTSEYAEVPIRLGSSVFFFIGASLKSFNSPVW